MSLSHPQADLLPSPLRAVVVVPAHDEERLIEACLTALIEQREIHPSAYEVIVVLDRCADRTAEIVTAVAARPGIPLIRSIEAPEPGVGAARAAGFALAAALLSERGDPQGPRLIASTDADSRVDDGWLAAQLDALSAGAAAVGGLIELEVEPSTTDSHAGQCARDARERARGQRLAALGGVGPEIQHPHFSGASLGIELQTYKRLRTGLEPLPALEDEQLERALGELGVRIHRLNRVRVTTSARTSGRAPRGLALDLRRSDWLARRSYAVEEFPLERLLAVKGGQTLSVVIPARQVASTIGRICESLLPLRNEGLIDELLVVDAASSDGTAEVARRAGAEIHQQDQLPAGYDGGAAGRLGPCAGKGDAMWRSLSVASGSIVAFLDGDTSDFHPRFLTGLVGPLLTDPEVAFVKGAFQRPFRDPSGHSRPDEGGRVTELLARPLLNLHFPELAVFAQPLAGETAGRRGLFERLPFPVGYGVEIANLIDAARMCGLGALAQVDLGTRQNRHQSLTNLSGMAYQCAAAVERRVRTPPAPPIAISDSYLRTDPAGEQTHTPVATEERPPAAALSTSPSRASRAGQPSRS